MKVNVTKVGAAQSQLIEAITLFFEDRDPVSIHTLVGAALQILNDHINDKEVVRDNNLICHYNTYFIKDEHRKFWNKKVNETRNFFKHADNDLKDGKISIEFETDLNAFNILEAIRCFKVIKGNEHIFPIEFNIFFLWFCKKYPSIVKKEARDFFDNIPYSDHFQANDLNIWLEVLRFAKEKGNIKNI
jgi:hypothetical protein